MKITGTLNEELLQRIRIKKHKEWDQVSSFMYSNKTEIDPKDLEVLYKITSNSAQVAATKSGLFLTTCYLFHTHGFPKTSSKMLKALFLCYLSIPLYISADEKSKLMLDLQEVLIYKYLPKSSA